MWQYYRYIVTKEAKISVDIICASILSTPLLFSYICNIAFHIFLLWHHLIYDDTRRGQYSPIFLKWSLTVCRILMSRWHFCSLLSCMYRKIKICHMIYHCLKSLKVPLLSLYLTCVVRYLHLKLNSYRKFFSHMKNIIPMEIWNFLFGIHDLPIEILIPIGFDKTP